MANYQQEKNIILEYFHEIENTTPDNIEEILKKYTAENYTWYGVYPFRQLGSTEEVATTFWKPLIQALSNIQRRQDIFIAGNNELQPDETWVMSMGNFMGLFDHEFLGIRPTGKIINIRYAEFNCVTNNKITKTGLFIDIIGLMSQAGFNPLPPSTGEYFVYPGPRNHDGLLFKDADPKESKITLDLINRMVDDLSTLNDSGSMTCPPELLEKTWHSNMSWYGPCGIGASYTIPRYQKQHQLPFRNNLTNKKFKGHVCRFSEGQFACFFGWPNLSNTAIGGFLGLPGGNVSAEMQVVDVYYRVNEKLSENWVFIDIPYWLKQQGVDIIQRTTEILNP